MPWEKEMERARRGHRPSLKNWERDGMYEKFPAFVRSIRQQQQQRSSDGDDGDDDKGIYCMRWLLLPTSSLPTSFSEDGGSGSSTKSIHPPSLPVVLDGANLDHNFFASSLEAKGIPCIIRNIPLAEGWRCHSNKSWELSALYNDPLLRNRKFKCGEDDDGKSIRVKLKHFLQYQQHNKDDSPLYVFDGAFDDDRKAKKILDGYEIPSLFRDDLFRFVSESRRPPYRWFLVGPERSGTTVHIDPLATAAWNTLLVGQKRWVLFPPQVPKSLAKGKRYVYRGEDDEAVHYFMTILPRIQSAAREAAKRNFTGDRDDVFSDFACYEFTQNPGDTVFIPNGWWHGVLNLTHTVGITQNFCSPRNFPQVWKKTRTGRKMMAAKWINQLDGKYPDLAKLAREMNIRDNFVMRYNPETVKRRDEHKKRMKQQRRLLLDSQQQQRNNNNNNSGSDNNNIEKSKHNHHSTTNHREHKRTRRDSSPNSVVEGC